MKEFFVLGPILALLVLGVFIALQSGVAGLTTRDGQRTVFDNLTSLLVRIAGYLAGLLAVQRFVGFPIQFPW